MFSSENRWMIKKTKGLIRVSEQLCSRTRNVRQNRRFRHTPICKDLTLKVAWEVENSKSRRVIYKRRQYECSGSIWALCGARGHEKVRPEQLNFHQYSSCACCFDAAILILYSLVNPVELFWNFFGGLICLLMIGKCWMPATSGCNNFLDVCRISPSCVDFFNL